MSPVRRKRLAQVGLLLTGVAVTVFLLLQAFSQNMSFYFYPTQVVAQEAPIERHFRLGGLVVAGSVQRDPNSLHVAFILTDGANEVAVDYQGILPDLFREEQGIIATGRLVSGRFMAEEVLAKHDENYMPPEVAASLKQASK